MAGVTKVPVYQPRLAVTLYRTIARTKVDDKIPVSSRFAGTPPSLDLTPWLSDYGSIRISKGVNEAAGGFTIVFADKAYKDTGKPDPAFDTLYGLIEPMSVVVIRAGHDTPAGALDLLPILMRGFITSVRRPEGIDPSGQPRRQVIVSGQDYGKIWQQLLIYYLPGYLLGENIITGFQLFERFGIGVGDAVTGASLVQQVAEKVLNPYLKGILEPNTPLPTTFNLDIKVKHGTTSVFGPQNEEGTIYSLLRKYLDVGPWNELFIEDRDEGVFVVFRPNPYVTVDGKTLIQMFPDAPDAVMPTIVDLPDTEISSIDLGRSDSNLANYYWVRAPAFDLVDDLTRQLFAVQSAERDTVLLDKYGNTAVALYGMRLMQVDTQMGGDEVTTFNSGQSADVQEKRGASMADWVKRRRVALVAMNKDNVVLEDGTITCRGRHVLKAGTYVRGRRGTTAFLAYVRSVDHTIIPFQHWTTTLQIDRALSFVERIQRGGGPQSPYLAEMNPTPPKAP